MIERVKTIKNNLRLLMPGHSFLRLATPIFQHGNRLKSGKHDKANDRYRD